jgi:hypothetical protein
MFRRSFAAVATSREGQRQPAPSERGGPSEGGISSAQYVVDHIFVYRCDQNLPHKINDV